MQYNRDQILKRGGKKKAVSIPTLLKKAIRVFNAWIRNRDRELPCISCGVAEVSEAGHYYPAGHYSCLKFNEINVNGQCTQCNCFKSGNLIHYRNGLLSRYSEQEINLLDAAARKPFKKWDRFELEYIIQKYTSHGR